MVARGDLGIEVPQERIPGIQRILIRKCVMARKPVIVATQMLHTMIQNPRPTRAEVTDIANAIYYRTDALMLSGETAYGKYPVEAVKTMTKIAAQAEVDKLSENDIRIPLGPELQRDGVPGQASRKGYGEDEHPRHHHRQLQRLHGTQPRCLPRRISRPGHLLQREDHAPLGSLLRRGGHLHAGAAQRAGLLLRSPAQAAQRRRHPWKTRWWPT